MPILRTHDCLSRINFAELFFIIQQSEVTTQCKQTQTWSCAMFTSSYIVATKVTISTVMK